MSEYKYRDMPLNEGVKEMVLSMLKIGRIMHVDSVLNKKLIMTALQLLNSFEIYNSMNSSLISTHCGCLSLLNERKFKKIYSEYPKLRVFKPLWKDMIYSEKINGSKFYFGKLVTPLLYKKYGPSILMNSCYYTKECFDIDGFVDELIKIDRPLSLPINNETIKLVIERMKYLTKNHERYWIYATSELYTTYIKRIYALDNVMDLNHSLLKELLEYHQSDKIQKMLGKQISHIPNIPVAKLAYILGIPSGALCGCSFLPSTEKVFELRENVRQDPERYISRFRERNIQILSVNIDTSMYIYGKAEICNTDNLYGEEILDYHEFDILSYSDDNGHIYSFTREEFPDLIERKKNPYNEIPFPTHVIRMMEEKTKLLKIIGRAKPIRDLWLENGIISNSKGERCIVTVDVPAKSYTLEEYISCMKEKKLIFCSVFPSKFIRETRGIDSNMDRNQGFPRAFLQPRTANSFFGFIRNEQQNGSSNSVPEPEVHYNPVLVVGNGVPSLGSQIGDLLRFFAHDREEMQEEEEEIPPLVDHAEPEENNGNWYPYQDSNGDIMRMEDID